VYATFTVPGSANAPFTVSGLVNTRFTVLPSSTVAESGLATGRSLTGVTVIDTVAVLLVAPLLSLIVYDIPVANPDSATVGEGSTVNLAFAELDTVNFAFAEPSTVNVAYTEPKFSEKSKGNDKDLVPDQYIVVLKQGVSKDKVSNEHGLLKKIHKYDHALNGFALKASVEKIEKLKNDNRVLFVQQDRIINITAQTLPTGIDRIDADLNPTSKIDGIDERVNVDVAILDTGIDAGHPDLNVAGGINFAGSDPTAWHDGHGHGTHVAGTVAGLDNDIGVAGVAPGARVWAVKVLYDSGSGYWSDVVEGIDWVTANADVIDVVNMSLGGYGSDDGNCGLTNSDSIHIEL